MTNQGKLSQEEDMVGLTRTRENPASLFGLQRLNRILDEAFGTIPFAENGNVITSTWFAPTDVSEDSNSLQISMELPGVNAEDVKLSLESNVLTIRGEKRQQSEETNERVHRYERSYGSFERTFVLPNTVDPEKIEAHYENGVLHVSIPKAERARPREIRVNATTGGTQVRTGSPTQRVSSQSSNQGNGSRDPEEEGSAAKSQR
jgi:HSP20 family protein